jgi:hypothetical protein
MLTRDSLCSMLLLEPFFCNKLCRLLEFFPLPVISSLAWRINSSEMGGCYRPVRSAYCTAHWFEYFSSWALKSRVMREHEGQVTLTKYNSFCLPRNISDFDPLKWDRLKNLSTIKIKLIYKTINDFSFNTSVHTSNRLFFYII